MKSLTELYSKLPTKLMLVGTTALAGAFYSPVVMAQDTVQETVVEAAEEDEVVVVRRHIKWHRFRPGLRETLLTSLVDIKRRLCGIASVDVRLSYS